MENFTREDLQMITILLQEGLKNHEPFYDKYVLLTNCITEDDFQMKLESAYEKIINLMKDRRCQLE